LARVSSAASIVSADEETRRGEGAASADGLVAMPALRWDGCGDHTSRTMRA
jgi:hypothetical protein